MLDLHDVAKDNNNEDDDDTEKAVKERADFRWRDDNHHGLILEALNKMRKNRHFCDVVLQIEKQEFFAHRAVLAAASPYLMDLFNDDDNRPTRKEVEANGGILYELNGGFERDALERLIEYAYTAR